MQAGLVLHRPEYFSTISLRNVEILKKYVVKIKVVHHHKGYKGCLENENEDSCMGG